jgi:dTDP-4-dehydrorhamnose 3,5-epimerase
VNARETSLPDVKLIEPEIFEDERGWFLEAWNARSYATAGLPAEFVQDNHSRSHKGVFRGLHYQLIQPQGKLVRVVAGSAFVVALDIRRSSPHFGRWFGTVLSAGDKRQLWVPSKFAHGFLALEEGTEYLYKCTDFHAPEHERRILFSDPTLGITLPPLDCELLLSAADARAPRLIDAETFE